MVFFNGAKAWKIEISAINDSSRPNSQEITLYDSSNNIISNPVSSNIYASSTNASSTLPQYAFDNDVNTGWDSNAADSAPWYIGFVHSNNIFLDHIAQHQYTGNADGAWKDVKLYYSLDNITNSTQFQNTNWILKSQSLGNINWSANENRILNFVNV